MARDRVAQFGGDDKRATTAVFKGELCTIASHAEDDRTLDV